MRRLAPTSPRVTDRPTRCEARPLDRLRVPGRLSPSPPHVTPYLTLATDRSPASLSLSLFHYFCFLVYTITTTSCLVRMQSLPEGSGPVLLERRLSSLLNKCPWSPTSTPSRESLLLSALV